MADQSEKFQAGQAAGQAQVKKDELVSSARDTAESCKQSCQESQEQAAGVVHQTAEKMMNMAQGATDAMKNAVGMGSNTGTTNQ
ncbi:hypothetical protein OPV22_022720 [Ensete ventricosum]|uniref:Uncharacterized protein n=1 Tax=Ensete ventricosum TaxID=4639 RepID=A0AAV8QV56_ENSVE|nr:hypothetical protein OPV22_022720 [Ensete ventricosum]